MRHAAVSAPRPSVGGMTSTDTPWEPPLAGTETEQVVGALDRLRATFRWKADGLDSAGLDTSIGASTPHPRWAAQAPRGRRGPPLHGEAERRPLGQPWEGWGWDGSNDWEFTSAADDTPAQLYAVWDGAVERSRARLAAVLAAAGSTSRSRRTTTRATTPTCAACCATSSRSTAATPDTPTSSARPSTAASARTRRRVGLLPCPATTPDPSAGWRSGRPRAVTGSWRRSTRSATLPR